MSQEEVESSSHFSGTMSRRQAIPLSYAITFAVDVVRNLKFHSWQLLARSPQVLFPLLLVSVKLLQKNGKG